MDTTNMLELKEFSSKYHSGLYVEGWISKEIFLKVLLEHPKVRDYLNKWSEEVRPTITVDCIEYCHMIFNSNPTVKFDYEPSLLTEIGNPVTFYEFWIYE